MTLAYQRFYSCVVVDLWQSLSVFWCAVARLSELLVKLDKRGSESREMLVQVCGDNDVKKTAVFKWVTRFSERRESVTDEERSGWPATSKNEENIAKFNKLCVKIVG
jgi:hypothetical protein